MASKRVLAWHLNKYSQYRIDKAHKIVKSENHLWKEYAARNFLELLQRVEAVPNPGDKKNVSQRRLRTLIRTLKQLRKKNVHVASRRIYSRYLNQLGYSYFSATRKKIQGENDKKGALTEFVFSLSN